MVPAALVRIIKTKSMKGGDSEAVSDSRFSKPICGCPWITGSSEDIGKVVRSD